MTGDRLGRSADGPHAPAASARPNRRRPRQFIEDQHNPKSPLFHHWIGAQELGQRYGVAQSDIEQVTGWLESYGFKVNVYQNHMFIDFSGTASQVENAFHTDIHYYLVNGETHTANASDPKIPSALAGVVAGPAISQQLPAQGDEPRIQQEHIDPQTGNEGPDYTAGGGFPLVPYDLQKIYNIAPLYSAGISGQGMKIVVVEDTNLWNCNSTNTVGPCSPVPATGPFSATPSAWASTRRAISRKKTQGRPSPTPAPSRRPEAAIPSGSGINGDDVEAAIDIEWATAAAPSASIINAACANPSGGFGGLTAIQNILNHPNADNVDVISMSYGESEESSGATLNASFNTTFQQAVAAGIGIFVSSGDEHAASSDGGGTTVPECRGILRQRRHHHQRLDVFAV